MVLVKTSSSNELMVSFFLHSYHLTLKICVFCTLECFFFHEFYHKWNVASHWNYQIGDPCKIIFCFAWVRHWAYWIIQLFYCHCVHSYIIVGKRDCEPSWRVISYECSTRKIFFLASLRNWISLKRDLINI